MNNKRFWLLIAVISLLVILIFTTAGCRGEVTSGGADKEEVAGEKTPVLLYKTLNLSEEPDKALFDKYFIDIKLHKNILLPHEETQLEFGFKHKKNFIFRTAVLNLETNDFIERCDCITSSDGSDGLFMEVLEWTFLSPGSYEYRIYVEGTLVAMLPFEIISYFDYFRFW